MLNPLRAVFLNPKIWRDKLVCCSLKPDNEEMFLLVVQVNVLLV